MLLIVRATRGGVRAFAAVALGFALASVALHAWYAAICRVPSVVLVIVTGLSAIGLGFAIGAVRGKIAITAMMLVVAALALVLLVDWTRSLFGLARIIDEVS